MAAGFNSFNTSGFGAFIDSGFNARGGGVFAPRSCSQCPAGSILPTYRVTVSGIAPTVGQACATGDATNLNGDWLVPINSTTGAYIEIPIPATNDKFRYTVQLFCDENVPIIGVGVGGYVVVLTYERIPGAGSGTQYCTGGNGFTNRGDIDPDCLGPAGRAYEPNGALIPSMIGAAVSVHVP